MKNIVLCMGLILLCSCFGGYSPQSQFYSLKAENPLETIKSRNISVGVNEVELPDYLNRVQMVLIDGNSSQIEISEEKRWVEPLSSMIQRVVAEDMANILPNAQVLAKTSLLENFGLIVDIQIVRFDIIKDSQVVLEAWWYIKNGDRIVLAKGKTSVSEKVDGGYGNYVNSLSNLLMKMSFDIAKKVAV
jgi:uncharacterized lipoprotein YmbA